ncbi:MAG: hypothetical protein ABGZ49_04500 [Akkermansiaceae bacterium]
MRIRLSFERGISRWPLRSFLKQEHLYRTEEFCARIKKQARLNMKRELEQLASAPERSGQRPDS